MSDPHITWRLEGNKIIFSTKSFAKYVYVDIEGYKGRLSDNYFDPEAGIEKRVLFDKAWLNYGKLKIMTKSLYDVRSKY